MCIIRHTASQHTPKSPKLLPAQYKYCRNRPRTRASLSVCCPWRHFGFCLSFINKCRRGPLILQHKAKCNWCNCTFWHHVSGALQYNLYETLLQYFLLPRLAALPHRRIVTAKPPLLRSKFGVAMFIHHHSRFSAGRDVHRSVDFLRLVPVHRASLCWFSWTGASRRKSTEQCTSASLLFIFVPLTATHDTALFPSKLHPVLRRPSHRLRHAATTPHQPLSSSLDPFSFIVLSTT